MSVLPEPVWIGAGAVSLFVGMVALVVPLPGGLWGLYLVVTVPLAILAGIWHVFVGRTAEDEQEARPWATEGAIVDLTPEASTARYPVSGQALSELIEAAAQSARRERSVDAGIDRIRPQLRATLEAALVQAGADADEVEDSLETGDWTDDPIAGSVLEARFDPPPQSLRRRLTAWLFPDRVVRQRLRRAVQAVAETIDEALPNVVGQRTRRTVPTHPPSMDELRRGADGSLHPAIDPAAIDPQQPGASPDGSDDDPATGAEEPTESDAETAGADGTGSESAETTPAESEGRDGTGGVETDPEEVLRR